MRKLLKIAMVVCGVFVGLLIVGGISIYFLLQSNFAREQAQSRVGTALGRETSIGGAEIDWGWTTRVKLRDVKIANADWAKDPHMLEADLVDFEIKLPPILRGSFVLPKIELQAPKIVLERNAKGTGNWSFGESPGVATATQIAAPENRAEAPTIGRLIITKGKMKYLDHQKKLALDGDLRIGEGEAEGADKVDFHADGKLEDKPLKVDFSGGSIKMLQDSEAPYPLKLAINFGNTSVNVEGKIADPFKMEGADLEMKLKGPDLAEVFPVLGVPAPPTPPYSLAGHLTHKGDVWQFQDMAGIVGNSDLTGDIKIDYGPKRPFLTAKLASKSLDFDDLGPLVGLPPATKGKEKASAQQKQTAQQMEAEGELFPNVPLKMEKLRVMDMDVTLNAHRVNAENYLPVQSLSGRVKIDNGRAVLDPLKLGIANGTAEGTMLLNAREDVPTVGTDLKLSGLDLAAFFKGSKYYETTGGKIEGQVKIEGTGKSLAEVMGSGRGDIRLGTRGGALSGLLIELAGLDIGQALILYVENDERIPILCGAGRIVLNKGDAALDHFVIDTTDSVLYFRGHANLKSQDINIEIEADAKDFSLLDIDAPVDLKGKIRKPAISIGKGVPIPLIEPGNAKEVSCDAMFNTVMSAPQN